MTFSFLSFFFVYFSARINYRDALPSKHTKDNGRKIFKKCFWRAFFIIWKKYRLQVVVRTEEVKSE